jgi:hypothetical protein
MTRFVLGLNLDVGPTFSIGFVKLLKWIELSAATLDREATTRTDTLMMKK